MINKPMTCLTLSRLQSLMVGRETSIQADIRLIDFPTLRLVSSYCSDPTGYPLEKNWVPIHCWELSLSRPRFGY